MTCSLSVEFKQVSCSSVVRIMTFQIQYSKIVDVPYLTGKLLRITVFAEHIFKSGLYELGIPSKVLI